MADGWALFIAKSRREKMRKPILSIQIRSWIDAQEPGHKFDLYDLQEWAECSLTTIVSAVNRALNDGMLIRVSEGAASIPALYERSGKAVE